MVDDLIDKHTMISAQQEALLRGHVDRTYEHTYTHFQYVVDFHDVALRAWGSATHSSVWEQNRLFVRLLDAVSVAAQLIVLQEYQGDRSSSAHRRYGQIVVSAASLYKNVSVFEIGDKLLAFLRSPFNLLEEEQSLLAVDASLLACRDQGLTLDECLGLLVYVAEQPVIDSYEPQIVAYSDGMPLLIKFAPAKMINRIAGCLELAVYGEADDQVLEKDVNARVADLRKLPLMEKLDVIHQADMLMTCMSVDIPIDFDVYLGRLSTTESSLYEQGVDWELYSLLQPNNTEPRLAETIAEFAGSDGLLDKAWSDYSRS